MDTAMARPGFLRKGFFLMENPWEAVGAAGGGGGSPQQHSWEAVGYACCKAIRSANKAAGATAAAAAGAQAKVIAFLIIL